MRLRDRLKAETASAHERLESQLDLTRESFSRQDLVQLLTRFLGYYQPCEDQIACAPSELIPLLEPRRKVPLLLSDLKQLGQGDASIQSVPLCSLHVAKSIPQVLGRWYVLEGSTLGGQFVARHLISRLKLTPAACSFFLSYGPEVGRQWQSFCELLHTHASPDHDDETVAAASATFASLGDWLRQSR